MRRQDIAPLRNVLVMVIADGRVTDAERELIRRLREKLGVEADLFDQLCEEIRAGEVNLEIPSGGIEAETLLRELLDASTADGEMTEVERKLLHRVGQYVDRAAAEAEAAIACGVEADKLDLEISNRVEAIYAGFGDWSHEQRLQGCGDLAKLGAVAVVPILHVVESYREPDGGGGLDLKAMMIDRLAALGDDRVVYYLAQQVSLGDGEDEVSCAALRAAAAEAVGKLTGRPFTRDAAGVQACRRWWAAKGAQEYRTLVL